MACPYVRLVISSAHPEGLYVCFTRDADTMPYRPPVAELREWCLTTCGNPSCSHHPSRVDAERRLAS